MGKAGIEQKQQKKDILIGFSGPGQQNERLQEFSWFCFCFLLHEVKLVFELTKDKWSFLSPITTVEPRYFEILGERKSFLNN